VRASGLRFHSYPWQSATNYTLGNTLLYLPWLRECLSYFSIVNFSPKHSSSRTAACISKFRVYCHPNRELSRKRASSRKGTRDETCLDWENSDSVPARFDGYERAGFEMRRTSSRLFRTTVPIVSGVKSCAESESPELMRVGHPLIWGQSILDPCRSGLKQT
jgi:hypothetical protein